MTMPPGKIVLLLLAIGWSLASNAQAVKKLSRDPARFPAEIDSLFSGNSSPTAEVKIRKLLDHFTEYWDSTFYAPEEKSIIISNANTLLSKKLPNYPNFYNYISIIYNFRKFGNKGAVMIWSDDFKKRLVHGTQRQLQSYLEQYESLVAGNYLYESSTFCWYISDSSFQLEYDTAIRIIYKKADLTCATNKDTSRILNTGGTFYPDRQEWIGEKGRVTWERVKFNQDSVYADLSNYSINLKEAEYHADTVKLINKRYFKEPLYGKLSEKVQASPPGPSSTYPQFVSYLKNYEIKNLFKNINYVGGFSVEGARIIGSGEVNQNATMYISKDGKLMALIRSNAFRILGDKISANPASLSIIADGDSIYHPGLHMNYFDDTRKLVMFLPESGISESPFFDGFHNIDMKCGALYWKLDSNVVDFESVPGVNRISINEFISKNFFSKYEFYKLQGIDERNPLFILRDFSRKFGTKEVTPEQLAQFMKKSPEEIKVMLLKLSFQGFLYYDLVNDKAIIQDRLEQYIDANSGKRDYDVISIKSRTDNISNATLSLDNYDLLVRGVKEVFLSDSQQVYIYPEKEEIIIKKDLDFVFSGNVKAGLFDFYAHDCSFEYDSFKLNIPLIDSLSFQVKSFTKDEKGNAPLVRVGSVIENLSGKILIDEPANKSGLKDLPEYPIFESVKESFVYYDHDRLYPRDSFAYHVYPFVLKSLDNFKTDNLQFDGYLVSAGIFPDIKQPLKVQPDYSLGFVNRAPAEGYPAYAGNGNYFDEVNLSNRGLRGKGQLKYLTSLTLADDFHFYPDTMITDLAKRFTIEPMVAKVEYPAVRGDSIYQVWYPYSDTMHLKSLRRPMKMYDENASLVGELYYSSTGLSGKGKVSFENVELSSEKYAFMNRTVDADTLDFKLFTQGTKDLVVSAEKYRTHIDFATRFVEFKTNQKGSTVSFPYNDFACSMDNIDLYMDQHLMKLYNDLGEKYANIDKMSREELLKLDLSGSDFQATNPEADSLSFFSVTARYDLLKYIIEAEDVKLIRVADAAIFPDSGYVKISQGGKIQTLKNAGIIADTANRYHTIEQAQADISSRKKYLASGLYQYHDTGNVVQEIPLKRIYVDSAGRTNAEAEIAEKLNFTLNQHFSFKGKMNLNSSRKELLFDGGFQIRDDCYANKPKYWVYFKSWVDPHDVRIPVQPPLIALGGTKVDLAIQISDYEEEIYSSWFTPKALPGDTALVAPSGEIYYDEKSDGYRVSKPATGASESDASAFLFNTRTCTMEASGPMGLGLSFNYVTMTDFGDIRYMVIPDSTTLNLTLTFDFLFYDGSLNCMSDSISKSNLKGLDVTRKDYQAFLDYAIGKAKSKGLKEDISLYGNVRRLPDELIHTIVLTDVNLYWNSSTNSYISKGPIGVMSLGRNPVNRYMNGHLELIRRRSGDMFTVYLEINPAQYYFFDYRSGIMQAISSDNEFNNRISEVKQDKRVQSKPGLEETYEYLVSSRRKMIDFLRRMEPYKN
jgi:hypothetical protein